MTETEGFQVGLLAYCADHGFSEDQTRALIKKATDKKAFLGALASKAFGAPIQLASAFGPGLLTAGALAAIGIPVAAGLTGGWTAAKMRQNNDVDTEEAKTDETLAEYDRLTEQALRQTALKKLRGGATLNPAGMQ